MDHLYQFVPVELAQSAGTDEHRGMPVEVRRGLSAALGGYDDAVGSLERSVMPAARKFRELQSMSSDDSLPVLTPLNQLPRQLQTPEFDDADAVLKKAESA